jgi:hypothetical protein
MQAIRGHEATRAANRRSMQEDEVEKSDNGRLMRMFPAIASSSSILLSA